MSEEELDKHQSAERDLRRAAAMRRAVDDSRGPFTEELRKERDNTPAMTQAPEMEKAAAEFLVDMCRASPHTVAFAYSREDCVKAVEQSLYSARSLSLSGQWQPISTAPKDEMFIWAAPKGEGKWSLGLAYRNVSGGWSDAYGSDAPERATRWCPLPAPPSTIPADEDISETSEGLPDPADRKP